MPMKTDLNAIKNDLRKLTDLNYLKKELGNIKVDIQNFNLQVKLSPPAKARLKRVEKRFQDLRNRMVGLQKQVDGEVNKFMQVLRKTKDDIVGRSGKRKTTRKKTTRKPSARKTTRK
jgi:hypothetical protein